MSLGCQRVSAKSGRAVTEEIRKYAALLLVRSKNQIPILDSEYPDRSQCIRYPQCHKNDRPRIPHTLPCATA